MAITSIKHALNIPPMAAGITLCPLSKLSGVSGVAFENKYKMFG